jgi:hypothetical protein
VVPSTPHVTGAVRSDRAGANPGAPRFSHVAAAKWGAPCCTEAGSRPAVPRAPRRRERRSWHCLRRGVAPAAVPPPDWRAGRPRLAAGAGAANAQPLGAWPALKYYRRDLNVAGDAGPETKKSIFSASRAGIVRGLISIEIQCRSQ